jgi:TolB protein
VPPPTRLLLLGQIGTRTDIPWPAVGVGWTLALAATPHGGKQDLVIVAPGGGVYEIATLNAGKGWQIVDRTGDGSRALLTSSDVADAKLPTAAVEVDLHSGATRSFVLPAGTVALEYTKPLGRAILASTTDSAGETSTIERLDLNGRPEQVLDRAALPRALMTIDGAAVVVNHVVDRTHAQLRLVGNDGRLIRTLPMPRHAGSCIPVRWLVPIRVLARCTAPGEPADRLYQIPVDGSGSLKVGTRQRDDKGPDYGDLNAWFLTTGQWYLSARGACGRDIIATQTSDGRAVQVFVPHQPDRNEILGVDVENRLLVESSREADGSCAEPVSFVWFDPVADRTTPFATRLPAAGERLTDALMWTSADAAY